MALGFWLWVSRGGEGCCSLSGTKRLCSALGGEWSGRWSDIVWSVRAHECSAGAWAALNWLPSDYLGTSGLGVAGTACEPVQGSFGWKIIGNGAAAVALPGAFLVCLWAGRARLAVTAKARVRSSLGSSTRRMAFKNRLGVILREVETRTLASHGRIRNK